MNYKKNLTNDITSISLVQSLLCFGKWHKAKTMLHQITLTNEQRCQPQKQKKRLKKIFWSKEVVQQEYFKTAQQQHDTILQPFITKINRVRVTVSESNNFTSVRYWRSNQS